MDPYKVIQQILEKMRERTEQARYSQDPNDYQRAILDNQERLAECLTILTTVLQVIVDKQITVTVAVPPEKGRS